VRDYINAGIVFLLIGLSLGYIALMALAK